MARNVITIPINKSSNTAFNGYIYQKIVNVGGEVLESEKLVAAAVADKLYCAKLIKNTTLYGMGLAWDSSLIPINKKIVSAKLYVYTLNIHNKSIYYRYANFSEGSTIPTYSPTDGAKSGGIASGWDSIDLGELKGNSIVVYADLQEAVVGGDIVYRYGDYWGLYSHRNATNKPYLEVVYDDIPPEKPTSLYPSGMALSTRDIIKFSWLHKSSEGVLQKSFELQYSINSGNTWATAKQTTPNQYYDMPANTLPTSGTVMWRVRTTDSNDEISEYETASFELGIVPQKAPIPIAPISQYLDENKPIKFEWNFVGGSGSETQSKFDLQYSVNSGSAWTTKTVTTTEAYYELPANTFSGGNVIWRVRTYNNWDEVSPYSENKSFTVMGSPPIPLILSVTNSGKPTVFWQSIGQHIYELEILKDDKTVFSSGAVPSGDKSFKLPIYLVDESYKAKLRIANEYNLYSPWAEKSFTTSTIKPSKPNISISNEKYSVGIVAGNTNLKTLVYRDGEFVGDIKNNYFADYTGENNREYNYYLRTIDENDNFADSDIVAGKCSFKDNTLAIVNKVSDFIELKYGYNKFPKKSNSFGIIASLQNYDGRKYSIVEYSEFSNMAKILSFYVRTKKEIDKIIGMIETRKAFLYRNRDGSNIYGTILSIDYDEEETFDGYEIAFTITRTEV